MRKETSLNDDNIQHFILILKLSFFRDVKAKKRILWVERQKANGKGKQLILRGHSHSHWPIIQLHIYVRNRIKDDTFN